jgi:hypothetical protein
MAGISFRPGAVQPGAVPTRQPLQEAVKILSLQMPRRTAAANPLASQTGSGFTAGSRPFSLGPAPAGAPGAAGAAPTGGVSNLDQIAQALQGMASRGQAQTGASAMLAPGAVPGTSDTVMNPPVTFPQATAKGGYPPVMQKVSAPQPTDMPLPEIFNPPARSLAPSLPDYPPSAVVPGQGVMTPAPEGAGVMQRDSATYGPHDDWGAPRTTTPPPPEYPQMPPSPTDPGQTGAPVPWGSAPGGGLPGISDGVVQTLPAGWDGPAAPQPWGSAPGGGLPPSPSPPAPWNPNLTDGTVQTLPAGWDGTAGGGLAPRGSSLSPQVLALLQALSQRR